MARDIDAHREAKTVIDPGNYGGVEAKRNLAICTGLFYIGKCIEAGIVEAAKILAKNLNKGDKQS